MTNYGNIYAAAYGGYRITTEAGGVRLGNLSGAKNIIRNFGDIELTSQGGDGVTGIATASSIGIETQQWTGASVELTNWGNMTVTATGAQDSKMALRRLSVLGL